MDGDPVQCYLDNTLQINRQLHESLRRKQEEISALKERNSQLKELLRQADHYAALLDELQLSPRERSPHPGWAPHPHPSSPQPAWLESPPLDTPPGKGTGWSCPPGSERHPRVRRQLWPGHHDSSAYGGSFTESPTKRPRLDRGLHQGPRSDAVRVCGSFNGLQVLTASSPPAPEENVRFRTSVGEHGTVRTRTFPQGRSLTSLTPDGACKFLWVPKHH